MGGTVVTDTVNWRSQISFLLERVYCMLANGLRASPLLDYAGLTGCRHKPIRLDLSRVKAPYLVITVQVGPTSGPELLGCSGC